MHLIDFLFFYFGPPSLFQVPLSLSRTFVVSRAESLAGSPGTVAFSVDTYTHLHHANVIPSPN